MTDDNSARLSINTIIGCRVQCTFCPQVLLMDRYANQNNVDEITWGNPVVMEFEKFKTCIDKVPLNVAVYFAGFAEPWINPECTKMLLYAYERGHRIGVYTTLVGMKLEDIEKIKHVKFEIFDIHLPDAQNYAKIAINKNYLEVLKKALEEISDVTYMSMGDLPPKIEEIVGNEKDTKRHMHDRAGNNEFGHKTPKKYGPLLCGFASKDGVNILNQNFLLPNGDVALCCMDYGLDHIIGNLITLNYDDLFKSEEFLTVKQKLAADDSNIMCRTCNASIKAKNRSGITKLHFCRICKNFFDRRDTYYTKSGIAICEDCGLEFKNQEIVNV